MGGIPPPRDHTRDTSTLYLKQRTFPISPRFHSMAFRQSLRLLGIGPELSLFQDKCFICYLDLDIASVIGCHAMPCCGKFIHKRCLQKARETSFQCGHCRVVDGDDDISNSTDNLDLNADETLDDSDDSPAWVTPPRPTLIELGRTAIATIRSGPFAHTLHQPGTRSWQSLPFRIDPIVWYLMWVNLDWFLSTIPEGPQSLYIHAVVYTPVEPVQHVRKTIYRLITQIIPSEARSCLTQIKHRLDFKLAGEPVQGYPYPFSPDEITFTNIRFTRFWSLWYYAEDYPYTTEVPPSPPESPDLGSAARTRSLE